MLYVQDSQQTVALPFIGHGVSPSPPHSPVWSLDSVSEVSPDADLTDLDEELSFDDDLSTPPTLERGEASDIDTSASMEPGDDFNMDTSTLEPMADETEVPDLSVTAGYKIVFDNVDKNVKPRYMRSDSQTRSLHCVHCYGVKDRVDFSEFSDTTPTEVTPFDIIPTLEDYKSLKNDFSVLVARQIVQFIPFFSMDYEGLVENHIPHKYSKEMSAKSEVVRIIIFLY